MTIEKILQRMGGVASRRTLIRAASRPQFDDAVRRGAIVRDAHGRYALPSAEASTRAAYALSGVLSHRSAANLPALDEALAIADSALRAIALDVPGLDLRPQVVISDRTGRGRADLVDRERRWVVEAESHSWHSTRGALRRDCRRYTKLVLLGWRVLRFPWEDVMFEQDYVRECLVAAAELAGHGAGSAPARFVAA